MKTSNLVRHALTEILIAYREDCDVLDGVEITDVIHAVEYFSEEGHSGGSAPYGAAKLAKDVEEVCGKKQAQVIHDLCMFKPLTPLTGDDSEWFIHGADGMYAQNVRCHHVFKREDGTAYDIQAVIFRDPDGSLLQTYDSRRDVTFPYVPETEVVDRPAAA
jgi:hypothetical protein